MKSVLRSLAQAAFAALATLTLTTGARAQFSYTFFPNNTTISTDVNSDFAIVGYTGGSYNDDFTRNFTGASSPAVQIADGANIIGEVDSFNNSIVNVTGGAVSGLAPFDNSVVNFSGGLSAYAFGFENSVINMSGGYISDLEGQGKAIHVSGGMMDTLIANVNTDVFGNAVGSCVVDVTGGSIGDVQSFNLGVLNLRGGTYAERIVAAFGGTVNIYGTDLSATLLDSNFTLGGGSIYSRYALSGTLADGTVLNNEIIVRHDQPDFDGSMGQSSFHLFGAAEEAPEPGSLALLVMGALPVGGMVIRRRRNSAQAK